MKTQNEIANEIYKANNTLAATYQFKWDGAWRPLDFDRILNIISIYGEQEIIIRRIG